MDRTADPAMNDSTLLSALGIPADYGTQPYLPRYEEAAELVEIDDDMFGRPLRLAPGTARDWQTMQQAALDDGIELLIVSGFRSIAYQVELIRNKLSKGLTIDSILRVNAAPGFSQHHTGMALDLATPGYRPLTEEFEVTPAFAWLKANAAQYAFSMPYGRDNVYGIVYEPWHWSQCE